jgi:hypothetical protein
VAAHGNAFARIHKKHSVVGIFPYWGGKKGAEHIRMTAGFVHYKIPEIFQVLPQVDPSFAHGLAGKPWSASDYDPSGFSPGMGINYSRCPCDFHFWIPLPKTYLLFHVLKKIEPKLTILV